MIHRGTDALTFGNESSTPLMVGFGHAGLFVAGSAIAVVARVVNQTMPTSIQTITFGLAVGISATVFCYRFVCQRKFQPMAMGCICFSVCGAVLLFPQLVHAQLAINATIQYATLVFLLRGALISIFVLPISLSIGSALAVSSSGGKTVQAPGTSFVVALIGSWLLMPLVGTPILSLVVVVLTSALATAGHRLFSSAWKPATKRQGLVTAGVVLAAVATPIGLRRFDTELSSQLLFSSAVFREYAAGTAPDLLLATDDGRRVRTEETLNGIRSVWRYAGNRIQVRQNGMPVMVTSVDSDTCPQSATELMPIVLPMLLHESAEHLLLLGDTGPAGEATSLLFPVTSVTSVEDGLRTVDETDHSFAARFEDDRLFRISSDPNLGLSGLAGFFDIIISRPDVPAVPASAPFYTEEFHARVAERLSNNGLFCQTFSQTDLGSEPLKRVLFSLRESFRNVSVIQIDGSELLLVASNGDQIVRKSLARRASLSHVRRILADLGWDWSRVLQLASLDSEAVDAIVSTETSSNSVSNAAFLCGLPLETMSWANKSQQLQEDIAAFERSLLKRLPQDEYRDEAARRIKESGQEAELLFGFPDEPWMYRKTLRTRLEQYSRPPTEYVVDRQVRRKPHVVDEYRKEYFRTLGEAVQLQAALDTDAPLDAEEKESAFATAISRLAAFTSPSEPLVSYFANHELVRLLEAADTDPATVFNHRLHTIYFVPGLTRSVREVVAAMNQLIDNPELIPDPATRWDQMNSLLQILMGRWNARRDVPPQSTHVALNDIEKSLLAMEASLEAMREWQVKADINPVLCENRETFLRRQLERPLRRFREQLMPHHYKHEEEQIAGDEAVDQFRPLGN